MSKGVILILLRVGSMGFVPVENAFLAFGIEQLKPQYEQIVGRAPSPFYLGNGVHFVVIKMGIDEGKLTIGRKVNGHGHEPDPRFKPVDCYNLWPDGMDLATAVRHLEKQMGPRLLQGAQNTIRY